MKKYCSFKEGKANQCFRAGKAIWKKKVILIISEMLRQDENIKSTILEDNFLLSHIFLKIIFG